MPQLQFWTIVALFVAVLGSSFFQANQVGGRMDELGGRMQGLSSDLGGSGNG